jgi:hypothetical protein
MALAGFASSMSICNRSIHQIFGSRLSSLFNIVLTEMKSHNQQLKVRQNTTTPETPTIVFDMDNEASLPPYSGSVSTQATGELMMQTKTVVHWFLSLRCHVTGTNNTRFIPGIEGDNETCVLCSGFLFFKGLQRQRDS